MRFGTDQLNVERPGLIEGPRAGQDQEESP